MSKDKGGQKNKKLKKPKQTAPKPGTVIKVEAPKEAPAKSGKK